MSSYHPPKTQWNLLWIAAAHLAVLMLLARQSGITLPRPPESLMMISLPESSQPQPEALPLPSGLPRLQPVIQQPLLPPVESSQPSISVAAQPELATVAAPQEVGSNVLTVSATAMPAAPQPITPPRSDAAHLDNPEPAYPALSRKLGEEGKVLLSVHILADGSVDQIKLLQSSGSERLDQAAIDAVKRWRYVPARQGGLAIALWHTQPINFSLYG